MHRDSATLREYNLLSVQCLHTSQPVHEAGLQQRPRNITNLVLQPQPNGPTVPMILRRFQLMAHLLIFMALLVHQTPVGPEDAFRANFSAIGANVRYRVQASLAAPIEALDELRAWTSAEVSSSSIPGLPSTLNGLATVRRNTSSAARSPRRS